MSSHINWNYYRNAYRFFHYIYEINLLHHHKRRHPYVKSIGPTYQLTGALELWYKIIVYAPSYFTYQPRIWSQRKQIVSIILSIFNTIGIQSNAQRPVTSNQLSLRRIALQSDFQESYINNPFSSILKFGRTCYGHHIKKKNSITHPMPNCSNICRNRLWHSNEASGVSISLCWGAYCARKHPAFIFPRQIIPLGPILLAWLNLVSAVITCSVVCGFDYLSIPKLQQLHRWSLGMGK